MAQLGNKIKVYLDREVDFVEEVKLKNDSDGKGTYIAHWSDSIEKPKPTEEQLNACESQATTLESNKRVIITRKKEYGTTAEQLEYIVENGVEAFIAKQEQIKLDNPKT